MKSRIILILCSLILMSCTALEQSTRYYQDSVVIDSTASSYHHADFLGTTYREYTRFMVKIHDNYYTFRTKDLVRTGYVVKLRQSIKSSGFIEGTYRTDGWRYDSIISGPKEN